MAIARKIDPAALARRFADEISAVPEVRRLWYRYRPNWIDPHRTTLHLTIQLERESKTADTAIADALTRLQSEYFDDLDAGSLQFTLSENDVLTLDDLVSPDFIELPLRGD
jgi:hypothetical protein